mmetsp:Transcript_132437/g.382844  ORF Transcript_132437/g.382844 Transcript_132437/m.382844 type:complete len:256 (-) Transcript_132437:120-887(-)
MDFSVVSCSNIASDAILSVRAGAARRQAPVSSAKPMQFPELASDGHPIKVDILKQVGSGYLVLKPNAEQYKIVFQGEKGSAEPSCEVLVKKSESCGVVAPIIPSPEVVTATAAEEMDAKAYLEEHRIRQFMQAVLHSVMKERPTDPYAYMARHFMSGYYPGDANVPVLGQGEAPQEERAAVGEAKPSAVADAAATVVDGAVAETPDAATTSADAAATEPMAAEAAAADAADPVAEAVAAEAGADAVAEAKPADAS